MRSKPIIGVVVPLSSFADFGDFSSRMKLEPSLAKKTVVEPGILPFPETEIPAGETVTIRTAAIVGCTFRLRRLTFATEPDSLLAWLVVTDIRIGTTSAFFAEGKIRAAELRGFKTDWGSPAMHAEVIVRNESESQSATVRLYADVETKRARL